MTRQFVIETASKNLVSGWCSDVDPDENLTLFVDGRPVPTIMRVQHGRVVPGYLPGEAFGVSFPGPFQEHAEVLEVRDASGEILASVESLKGWSAASIGRITEYQDGVIEGWLGTSGSQRARAYLSIGGEAFSVNNGDFAEHVQDYHLLSVVKFSCRVGRLNPLVCPVEVRLLDASSSVQLDSRLIFSDMDLADYLARELGQLIHSRSWSTQLKRPVLSRSLQDVRAQASSHASNAQSDAVVVEAALLLMLKEFDDASALMRFLYRNQTEEIIDLALDAIRQNDLVACNWDYGVAERSLEVRVKAEAIERIFGQPSATRYVFEVLKGGSCSGDAAHVWLLSRATDVGHQAFLAEYLACQLGDGDELDLVIAVAGMLFAYRTERTELAIELARHVVTVMGQGAGVPALWNGLPTDNWMRWADRVGVETLAGSGELDRAVEVAQVALCRWPGDPVLVRALAEVLAEQGALDSLLALVRASASFDNLMQKDGPDGDE